MTELRVVDHVRWMSEAGSKAVTIWTIGHSTRDIAEFLELLARFRIAILADVRSVPGSRRYPQYGKAELAQSLRKREIDYHWLKALGGPSNVPRVAQHRMAQCLISWLRRLHGKRRILERTTPADRTGHGSSQRHDVRGGGLVALSSLDDRRCPLCARYRGRTHHRCQAQRRASDDLARADRARRVELCGSGAGIRTNGLGVR